MRHSIEKTVLANGLTVISETIPGARSVSVGVWVKAGSRHEHVRNNGVAHFIEHLVFKGTQKRSALQIARSLEDVGGNLNAYTGKELTHFYAAALDSHLARCVDVLIDLVCNPLFREKDIEKEKDVVLEEIIAVKDTPEEYIYDVFQEKLFPGHPLGYPILGTPQSLAGLTRKDVLAFWQSHYTPQNMVISAAGNLEHNRLVHLINEQFQCKNPFKTHRLRKPHPSHGVSVEIAETFNQAHILAGIDSVPYASTQRYEMAALNAYLGGGMSSRLFQVLREHHGLAYTVYSAVDFFKDSGIFSVYLATDERKRHKAVELLFKEIQKTTENPIRESDVKRIREQLKGSLLLGLENISQRMARLAKNELYFGRQISVDETIRHVEKLTSEKILQAAQKIFTMDQFNIIQMKPNA